VTHYDVLGVDPKASAADIRKAYLARARRVHPDFHTGEDAGRRAEAEQQMRVLNDAWAVLGDEERRGTYDADLAHLERQERRTRPTGVPSPKFVPYDDDDTDYSALLDEAGPGNGATIPRAVQLAPVVLLGVAVFAFSAALVTGLTAIYAGAIVALVLSALSFLLTPALAVMRSLASDRD